MVNDKGATVNDVDDTEKNNEDTKDNGDEVADDADTGCPAILLSLCFWSFLGFLRI